MTDEDLKELFEKGVARMVAEHGESHVRLYLKTYIEVMLEDPEVDEDTKKKIRAVWEFLSE